MTKTHHPIRTTLFWGLISGLLFIPLNLALDSSLSRSSAICLTFWLFLAGYTLLLSNWSKKTFVLCAFPLLLLCMAIFLVKSISAFFLLSMFVTSWIRSGIFFQKPAGTRLLMEILLCVTGGILITVYSPTATFSGALGIWMFFLVQAIYFIIFDTTIRASEDKFEIDPFDRASKRAEDILSNASLV